MVFTRICVIQQSELADYRTQFVKSLKKIYSGKFIPPENVKTPAPEFLNLGVILINLSNSSRFDKKFEENAVKELNSILTYSSGTPVHLVVLTNNESVESAAQLVGGVVARRVSEQVIFRRSWRWSRIRGVPVIKTSYVDVSGVVKKHQAFVNVLKKYSDGMNDAKNKYAADLFYIAPLYHLTFPNLNKIIMIDCSDLMFQDDIKLLFDEFDHMGDHLIGITEHKK